MKQYRPKYYNKFKCIASECKDNCCIGWEIDIDEKSLNFYKNTSGEIGKKLSKEIEQGETCSHFRLNGERCPFLNEKNLCEIYISLGEKALCEICTEHPRYHEWYGDWKESGIGLSCEAAAKIILTEETPTEFEIVEIEENSDEEIDEFKFNKIFFARETALKLLENKEFSLNQKLKLLLCFGEELQENLDFKDWENFETVAKEYRETEILKNIKFSQENENSDFKNFFKFLNELEAIDESWKTSLKNIEENFEEIINSLEEIKNEFKNLEKVFEKIAGYFIYRYFCKTYFDKDLLSKIMLSIFSCIFISLLNGEKYIKNKKFGIEEQIETAKLYSKQIEYCEENLNKLCESFWSGESITQTQILSLTDIIF